MTDVDPHPVVQQGERRHIWDDPRNVRRLLGVFFGACALLFLIDLVDLVGRLTGNEALIFKHPHYAVEKLPGFYAIYGLVGCVLLVLAARVLRRVVMRPESYYDDGTRGPASGDDGPGAAAAGEGGRHGH